MSIYKHIQSNLANLSPAMKKIADYFLSHFDDLMFESAEHIAEQLGLSSISVGRYLRQLGFQNMDDLRLALKNEQRQHTWRLTDRLAAQMQRQEANDDDSLLKNIQQLQKVHWLRTSDAYQQMLKQLQQATSIHIIGLQSCRGLMLYFYSLLEYMRPQVHYSDGHSGAFVDVFNQNQDKRYIVLADVRQYAMHSQRLCLAAEAQQIDYGFITDVYCPWATHLKGNVLQLETDTQQFWDSPLPLLALLQSLLNDLAHVCGSDMQSRIEKNKHLQNYFGQFED